MEVEEEEKEEEELIRGAMQTHHPSYSHDHNSQSERKTKKMQQVKIHLIWGVLAPL